MKLSFWRELGFTCISVARFLEISISRAMGCFFACFRTNEGRHRAPPHLVSTSATASMPTEILISQNRLSSLFISEDKVDSGCNDRETPGFGSPVNHKDLKNEAKFLKYCGTLAETPAEFRKATEKLNGSPPYERNLEGQKFHSWLPNTTIKKLQLDKQPDLPPTPDKLCEEWGKVSGSQERTPSSCISSIQNTGRTSFSSTEGNQSRSINTAVGVHGNQTEHVATDARFRNKSVRFDCDIDASNCRSSSENVSQNPKNYQAPGDQSVSEPLPYPTPLKLSDEMQTPGTVFPTKLENLQYGKTRIRSHYVYSVLNPVESDFQWKELKKEDSKISGELRESLEFEGTPPPRSEEGGVKETLPWKDLKVEASPSAWLKPQTSIQDANNENYDSASAKTPHFGRTLGDRPIIGLVASHWNNDEPSHISPKWWDGNGIPNSTNKYKEDQKVSWHATPFEERLEKALSEESFITQKKDIYGKPVAFDENDESDTALSQLQSSAQPKSVVSF
ncbi:protein JASON-like [Juglans microcarpa x Juglans regia]|uniref:protein JASON-like n=1 Tax=Juglans microcarpa x Juglans regia TaxID=2249226 RepID=UPI001B7F1511|nr:protein JASON-like [Juglans microcarpa x Juglans regia]